MDRRGVWRSMDNIWGFPSGSVVKKPPCNAGDAGDRFNPSVEKIPWQRAWQSTKVFLPRESHGQKSLAGYSPRGHRESDMTEHTHIHSEEFIYHKLSTPMKTPPYEPSIHLSP